MQPWTPTIFFLSALLDALIGHDPSSGTDMPLEGVYFGLYQTPAPTISQGLTMAGITECNYTGYARQPVVWFPVAQNGVTGMQLTAALLQFRATDAVAPNVALGCFIADRLTGGDLLLVTALSPPLPLQNTLQVVNAVPYFALPFAGTYGTPDVSA